jgi:hypothetical protein
MWQRIQWWVVFSVVTLTTFVCGVLYVSGSSAYKVFAIAAPVVFVCILMRTISVIVTSSNRRTKKAVDWVMNRVFKFHRGW